MSPNPTVEKIVIVKYSASVRVSGAVKFGGSDSLIKKYVDANKRRNSGTDEEQCLERPQRGIVRASDLAQLPRHETHEDDGADHQPHEGGGVGVGEVHRHDVIERDQHRQRSGSFGQSRS